MRETIQFVFLGLGLGAMYALLSHGLIVIYRGSGVLNFAHGAIGMVAAYLFYDLHTHGWAFPFALLAGVAAAALVGVLVQITIMRQLQRAAPMTRVVATLGVLITLQAIAVLHYGSNTLQLSSDLPDSTITVFGVPIAVDRLILCGIAILLAAVLWTLYRYTAFGRSTSAVAENPRAAASLGLAPARIAALNWALGSALAGVACILLAPIVTLTPSVFTTLLIAALAAALVANFQSFPIALVAGLLLGVAQSEVSLHWSLTGAGPSVPFVVIAAVLVVRGRAIPLRDFVLQRLPSVGTGRIRPVFVLAGTAVAAVVLGIVPADWQDAITVLFAVAIVLLSTVVVTGYAGQISLGQFALAGFGAWVAGRLAATQGFSFPLALLTGVACSIPVGAAFGLPALRARGINLAIMTVGLATALQLMLFGNGSLTGGFIGTSVPSPSLFGWSVDPTTHPGRYGWVALAGFVIVALLVANLRRGRTGRRLLSVRSNERAASALGVDVVGAKVYAFALSAAIAAVGGVLIAFQYQYIDYTQFDPVSSITYVGYAILGGVGYVIGPLFGATLAPGSLGVPIGNHVLSGVQNDLDLIGGLAIIVVVLANQNGIAPELGKQLRWLALRIPLLRNAVQRLSRPSGHKVALSPAAGVARRVPPKVLKLDNLVVKYGSVVAVDHVSLRVDPGRILGLIGPNGAGKTTVIDALSGFVAPSSGAIELDGENVARWKVAKRARNGVSRSFQSLELFEDETVLENIRTACDERDWLSYFRDLVWPVSPPLPDRVIAAIDEFGLADALDLRVEDLPYGKRRLLAILRAIAASPSVLLLDEPAAGLGDKETAELGTIVRRLADEWGIGVLLVEHDMSFVMSVCDELVVLDFGRQIASGQLDVVRRDPAVVSAYLGVPTDEAGREVTTKSSTPASVTLGRSAGSADSVGEFELGPVLEARGMTVGYGSQPVVRSLDLSVSPGEVVVLLGANGAGKTTTLLALAGELPLLGGEVVVAGSATTAPLFRRARGGLAMVPEERATLRQLTTLDNLRLGDADPELALKLFPELEKRLKVPAGMLSGGEQQMLVLGRALSRRPKVLLADELSLGLAPMATQRLLEAVRASASEDGTAVILVEQHVRQALRYADRGYVMRRGNIEVHGSAADLEAQIEEIESTYMASARTGATPVAI